MTLASPHLARFRELLPRDADPTSVSDWAGGGDPKVTDRLLWRTEYGVVVHLTHRASWGTVSVLRSVVDRWGPADLSIQSWGSQFLLVILEHTFFYPGFESLQVLIANSRCIRYDDNGTRSSATPSSSEDST